MSFPANVIPVFGSQRAYADLNFSGGSFGLDGRIVNDLTALPGFSFTRASLAMGYDATGKLTYGPNNLLVYSEQFDNAGWLKTGTASVTANTVTAPDGTLTADTLSLPATSDGMYRTAPLLVGQQYIISVWMRADSAGSLSFTLPSTAPSNVVSVTTSWQRFSYVFTAAAASDGPFIRRTLVGYLSSVYLWGAQLEAVTYQTTPSTYYPTTTAAYYGPRLVYDPVTLASLGILVEEARTNVNVQSNTLTNAAWAISAATIGGTPIVAPDGSTTASVMDDGVTAAEHFITIASPPATTASTNYTYSIYVKNGTRRYVGLSLGRLGSSGVYVAAKFDLVAGTYVTTTAGGGTLASAGIEAVGNDWWRISVCGQLGAVTDLYGIFWMGNDATTFGGSRGRQSYTGTNATVYPWGAQLEAGTGASSPIPTTTASVTRAGDDVVLTGLSLVNSGLTVVSEARGVVGFAGNGGAVVLDDGSSNNRLTNYTSSVTSLRAFSAVGGSGVNIVGGTATDGAPFKQATAFDGVNRVATSGNGSAVATGTNALTPALFVNMRVGRTSQGLSEFRNGTISRIRVYKTALSDAQLQSLST